MIYTLAQIRNGTGFRRGIRFRDVNDTPELLEFAEAVEGLIAWAREHGANKENCDALENMRALAVKAGIAQLSDERHADECQLAAEAFLREKKKK